jgi:hypothetical protein
MNNWRERDGANNHEGDWESVFIYLDNSNPTNPYPKYVAYSSHLNDGENEVYNPFQHDSVRRNWNSSEVMKVDGQIISFVAQGSHANYPNNNEVGHVVPTQKGHKIDKTSSSGLHFLGGMFRDIESENSIWDQYQGKWGADTTSAGEDGPQGPSFTSPTFGGGVVRFENPLKWASIDKIQEQVIMDPVTTVPFENSNILLKFSNSVPSGTSISVTPYYEPVTFGIVPSGATMLPGYYDLFTSMDNGTFEVSMIFPYDAQYIESLGATPENIRFGFYNESMDTWEKLPTVLDEQSHSVSTTRTGFSRYALMLVEQEKAVALEEEEIATSQSTRTNRQGTRVYRNQVGQVLGATVSVANHQQLMMSVGALIGLYPQMTYQQKQTLLQILEEVLVLIKNH